MLIDEAVNGGLSGGIVIIPEPKTVKGDLVLQPQL